MVDPNALLVVSGAGGPLVCCERGRTALHSAKSGAKGRPTIVDVFAALIPLVLALLAAPAALLAGALKPAYAAPVGTTFAALAALVTLWGWLSGGGTLDISWVPSWNVHFTVALDGLAALMALLVTGITAVLLLIGALLLYAAHGTFSIPDLARLVEPGPLLTGSGLLIAVAGLAKSAQAPFHFWLPRAMAAPTPVSAYLHSAAMVAAGVLLIGRVYPLLQRSEILLDALLVVGMASMAVGGLLALTRDVLKQLLAYSTIAQYGFVVTMYGLGGPYS